jgi:hypothetical protein
MSVPIATNFFFVLRMSTHCERQLNFMTPALAIGEFRH